MAEKITPVLYSCEICGQESLDEFEMKSHMLLAHVEGAISCPFCDLSDIPADDMTLHVNTEHLDCLSPSEGNHINDEKYLCDFYSEKDNNSDITMREDSDSAQDSTPEKAEIEHYEKRDRAMKSVAGATSSELSGFLKDKSFLSLDIKPKSSPPKKDVCGNEIFATPDEDFTCPICGHMECSPTELQEHVNRQHLDFTTPSRENASHYSPSPNFRADNLECPLCIRRFQTSLLLELHVNHEHKDILSPTDADNSLDCRNDSRTLADNACPVCGAIGMSKEKLILHVENHFRQKENSRESLNDMMLAEELEKKEREEQCYREQREFEQLQLQYGMDSRGNYQLQSLQNMERAVYNGEMTWDDYYNRQMDMHISEMSGVDDGHSCTKGLIPKIKVFCNSQGNTVVKTWMCSNLDHYSSTYGDKGWGCGYRNIQMLLSSLLNCTKYRNILFGNKPAIPSITKIQELIEDSWNQGFDPQGCEQLDRKLTNTRKWIGATEVVALFSSFKIKCHFIDFHFPTGEDGTHPRMFQWLLEYFQKQEDFKPPIYLQHQGHSRTVIGVEQLCDGNIRLLVFDPSHSRKQMNQFHGVASCNIMRLLRRALTSMKAKQYQVVGVKNIMTEQEFQRSKILQSERIP